MRKKENIEQSLKFIDLFAGLGGFHQALSKLGHKCVFASELSKDLRELYTLNYPGVRIEGDITSVSVKDIPKHDILCGGFPCQPFSQAGKRLGFIDEERGNLFNNIMEILTYHTPKYVILENVPNLKNHDSGNTWKVIQDRMNTLYDVREAILSPHQFGIPQHRFRIYIVGILRSESNTCPLKGFEFPEPNKEECNINTIVNPMESDFISLKRTTREHLDVWQDFIDNIVRSGGKLPTFPIWAMEFGADYDYEDVAPAYQNKKQLKGRKGALGRVVTGVSTEDCVRNLPIYAQTAKDKKFPSWKINFIRRNRDFYNLHKEWLVEWIKKIDNFENSHQKFEWNCGIDANPSLYDKIIQFRPSGIRVKKTTYSPALVLTTTQIPIFPWVKLPEGTIGEDTEGEKVGRYMSKREAAALQGMCDLIYLPETTPAAFKALGNAVNVDVVMKIVDKLIDYGKN